MNFKLAKFKGKLHSHAIQFLEAKEREKRILKATGENWLIIEKGTIIQMTADFLSKKH